MNAPIMSQHEARLLLRIEVMQRALHAIAMGAHGISDKDTVRRMQLIALRALEGKP